MQTEIQSIIQLLWTASIIFEDLDEKISWLEDVVFLNLKELGWVSYEHLSSGNAN